MGRRKSPDLSDPQGRAYALSRRALLAGAALLAGRAGLTGPAAFAASPLRLADMIASGSDLRFEAGTYAFTPDTPVPVDGTLTLQGAGVGQTVLDFADQSEPALALRPGSNVAIRDLRMTGGTGLGQIPARRAEDLAVLAEATGNVKVAIERVQIDHSASAFWMSHDGLGNDAFNGIESLKMDAVRIADVHRGLFFGDRGHHVIGDVAITDLEIERAGRFGLVIGGTYDDTAALTRSISIDGLVVRDLIYEADKNCAHLVVVGRNVRIRNVLLEGALADRDSAFGESDKEALYLKAVDADLENVVIRDTLGDQAGLVLKGRPLDSDHLQAKGGRYRIRDLRIEETERAPAPMRGIWVQTSPVDIDGAVFSGLSRQSIQINGPVTRDISLRNIEINAPRGRVGIGMVARDSGNVEISGARFSGFDTGSAPRRYTGIHITGRKKNSALDGLAITSCAFDLNGGTGKATGIRFVLNNGASISSATISGCNFNASTGIEIVDKGGRLDLTIEDCDFSNVADPAKAISFQSRYDDADYLKDRISIRIGSGNRGLDMRSLARLPFTNG